MAQLAWTGDVTLPTAPAAPIHIGNGVQPTFAPATIPERLRGASLFGRQAPAGGTNTDAARPALLAGSIMVRGRGVALLQIEGGQIVRLAPGSRWRGMRLERLTADAAVFRAGNRVVTVPFGSAVQP